MPDKRVGNLSCATPKGPRQNPQLPNGWPSAATVIKNAQAALQKDEEIFRIFYYDCEPLDREVANPVEGSKFSYKTAAPSVTQLEASHSRASATIARSK